MDIEKVASETPNKIITNKIDLRNEGPKSEEIEKNEILPEKNDEPTIEENNVIKLEPQEKKDELKIFDEKNDEVEPVEKPLILTKEVEDKKQKTEKTL